jgi:hypothetical protein
MPYVPKLEQTGNNNNNNKIHIAFETVTIPGTQYPNFLIEIHWLIFMELHPPL